MTSSTDEKDEGRELEARVVVVEGVEKQVSGGLCDNFAEEEEKVVFIFCAMENPRSWVNFNGLSPHLVPIALESELSEAEHLSHHPSTTTLVIESYFSVMLTNAAHRWSTILKKCP